MGRSVFASRESVCVLPWSSAEVPRGHAVNADTPRFPRRARQHRHGVPADVPAGSHGTHESFRTCEDRVIGSPTALVQQQTTVVQATAVAGSSADGVGSPDAAILLCSHTRGGDRRWTWQRRGKGQEEDHTKTAAAANRKIAGASRVGSPALPPHTSGPDPLDTAGPVGPLPATHPSPKQRVQLRHLCAAAGVVDAQTHHAASVAARGVGLVRRVSAAAEPSSPSPAPLLLPRAAHPPRRPHHHRQQRRQTAST
mmetsp:Transcript_27677/g.79610  ORF Transcript_27677/g.79610 Transcript_27677/m.79610 type:complete len:254 (+) Transcript_27677:462-1223(+)